MSRDSKSYFLAEVAEAAEDDEAFHALLFAPAITAGLVSSARMRTYR
jgi:hypothetical protein